MLMIIDHINNVKQYKGMLDSLDTVIEYIINNDISQINIGKTVIDNDSYIMCFDYQIENNVQTPFEMHEKYGDFHIMLANSEIIKCATIDYITLTKEYNESEDVSFGDADYYISTLIDKEHFVIVFPNDAHSVKNYAGDTAVKKIVFKFRV